MAATNTPSSSSSSPSSSSSRPPPNVVCSPCAACKILRRRCTGTCLLAPYFPPTDPAKFTTAHRVFGASNIIKVLQEQQEDGHLTNILYPKSLIPSSGAAGQGCWKLYYGETTSRNGEKIQVAELKKTNRLDLKGSINMKKLRTGVAYEVVFVVKLKQGGCGWEHPVTLKLSVPGEGDKNRLVNLYEQPKEEWIELKVGHFIAAETGQAISFHLLQHGPHDKKGLVLKTAIVRPKS